MAGTANIVEMTFFVTRVLEIDVWRLIFRTREPLEMARVLQNTVLH